MRNFLCQTMKKIQPQTEELIDKILTYESALVNYPYFEKYVNLPLCLENYALFSLPLIFTNILHTYTFTLRNIINIGKP